MRSVNRIFRLLWIAVLISSCTPSGVTAHATNTQPAQKAAPPAPTPTNGSMNLAIAPEHAPQSPSTKTPQPFSQATATRNPSTTNPLPPAGAAPTNTASPSLAAARDKIKHIVIIMQENRSFDSYFGTFPGADGIPMSNGVPTVCIPEPQQNTCVKPFHDSQDINSGGPHTQASATTDINGGKMDGFISAFRDAQRACTNTNTPGCNPNVPPDVMGWHDAREIPNYWAYAENFVLQDRMFESVSSRSLTSHLYLVSGWSADCTVPDDPSSCVNAPDGPTSGNAYAWTDLTYLMHKYQVTWAFYLSEGNQPDCIDNEMLCAPGRQTLKVSSELNPLPGFTTVQQDGQLGNIQTVNNFYTAAKNGTLPQVSWIVPNDRVSEHPPSKVSIGQTYVTGLINAIMQGPDWESTAIFLAWDDWGGFYDHIVPPNVDLNGYGLRVPGLVISAYARKGYIDHQTLSFDAYLKFIEDLFMGGQRIDPANDGRPDPRPTVRENVSQLGDLLADFDFSQAPRPPLILPVNPPPGPASIP